MQRDTMKAYRIDQLGVDASTLDGIAERARSLIADLPMLARAMQDTATGDALVRLAQALSDCLHDEWAAVVDAHERAADEEGIEPIYTADLETLIAFGMAQPAKVAAKVQIGRAHV